MADISINVCLKRYRSIMILIYESEQYYQRVIDIAVNHIASRWAAYAGIIVAGHGGFGNVKSVAGGVHSLSLSLALSRSFSQSFIDSACLPTSSYVANPACWSR